MLDFLQGRLGKIIHVPKMVSSVLTSTVHSFLPYLVLFIYFCGSKFLSHIIFLLPEDLRFLVVQVCW